MPAAAASEMALHRWADICEPAPVCVTDIFIDQWRHSGRVVYHDLGHAYIGKPKTRFAKQQSQVLKQFRACCCLAYSACQRERVIEYYQSLVSAAFRLIATDTLESEAKLRAFESLSEVRFYCWTAVDQHKWFCMYLRKACLRRGNHSAPMTSTNPSKKERALLATTTMENTTVTTEA